MLRQRKKRKHQLRYSSCSLLGEGFDAGASQDFGGGFGAGANAIGDADAGETVAGESEAGEIIQKRLDALQAVEMTDGVLRHGRTPFVDTGEKRLGTERDDRDQFVAHDGEDLIVGGIEDRLVAGSAEEAADQGAIVRGAMRKFIVNESCGQHAVAGAAGDKKSKAGRQRAANGFIVAERHGDG